MGDSEKPAEADPTGRLFVPALVIAGFAVGLSTPMLSILTTDMANTFFGNASPVSLGLVAQVGTVNNAAEVVFALLMGFLAVRFRSKPLLLLGAVFMFISAVGSFFAPNLPSLQFFYALEGAATVIVTINSATLVGELLPTHKKAKVVSYTWAIGSAASLAGIPLIGMITNFGGWKFNFLLMVLPFSALGLAVAYFGLPSRPHLKQPISWKSYFNAFSQVLRHRSALACLLAGMLGAVGYTGVFALAFYRRQFFNNLPVTEQINYAVIIWLVASAMSIVAALVIGRIVNRVGAVKLIVLGAIGNCICAFLTFIMPSFGLAFTVQMIHVWFFAAAITAWLYVTLDQVPVARGTMMSLRAIFSSIGFAIGAAAGGLALALFGTYQAVGITLSAIIFPGIPLAYLFIKDPHATKNTRISKTEIKF
jgi:predicted MFS family arabinose efflux permease